VLQNIIACWQGDGSNAPFNLGGYCNEKVDALKDQILVENDTTKRNQMIYDAFMMVHDEAGYIPLHQQALAWGVNDRVDIVQRPDNQILLYWAKIKE
jgi:peptide/nickel transport system substrate-binding protein